MAAALVAIALTAGLDGGGGSASSRPAAARPPGRRPVWIVSGDDLELLRRSNAGLARRFFDNRRTFVVGKTEGRQNLVPPAYRAVPALSYSSLAHFEADVRAEAIDASIRAIVYDPESWAKTPAPERRDPLAAMRRFTALARARGYGPIVAPGRDLALVEGGACTKAGGELLDDAYLRCGLTGGVRGAGAFVIQAAADELELPVLRALLELSRAQLRRDGAGAQTIATLSTSPPGATEPVYPIDLVRAARLELAEAGGVMLNFSAKDAPLAASFLRDLERAQD